jgi:lipopolysaccharide transport system ATP-binding protein
LRAPWRSLASRWSSASRATSANGRHLATANAALYPSRSGRDGASSSANNRVSVSARAAAQEDFWALREVSFEVERGEVVGIIGRNGAGKSTLLKIISRITEPTTGEIEIEGRVASLLEVATGFHPELTGRENVFLNGALLGMTRAEIRKKFDEIAAFAEVERFLDTPVKRYSSGMYVRLAFAIAAHLEPDILIVDEVLAVGDAEFQKKCLGKMSEAARGGRTVLFVSHNTIALRNLCERGVVLDTGRKKFDGAIGEALHYYAASSPSAASQSWVRSANATNERIVFESINGELNGQQPHLTLRCTITLRCVVLCAPSFVAVDICDQASSPLMQALPKAEPFIKGVPGVHKLRLEIDLPPLIPGQYEAHFWIGAHYTATFDHVRRGLVFEIDESPSAGRTFPHSKDCGHIVPVSRCEYGGELDM